MRRIERMDHVYKNKRCKHFNFVAELQNALGLLPADTAMLADDLISLGYVLKLGKRSRALIRARKLVEACDSALTVRIDFDSVAVYVHYSMDNAADYMHLSGVVVLMLADVYVPEYLLVREADRAANKRAPRSEALEVD